MCPTFSLYTHTPPSSLPPCLSVPPTKSTHSHSILERPPSPLPTHSPAYLPSHLYTPFPSSHFLASCFWFLLCVCLLARPLLLHHPSLALPLVHSSLFSGLPFLAFKISLYLVPLGPCTHVRKGEQRREAPRRPSLVRLPSSFIFDDISSSFSLFIYSCSIQLIFPFLYTNKLIQSKSINYK